MIYEKALELKNSLKPETDWDGTLMKPFVVPLNIKYRFEFFNAFASNASLTDKDAKLYALDNEYDAMLVGWSNTSLKYLPKNLL